MNVYLYIMESKQADVSFYKIGVTNNLDKRLKSIRTGNPNKVNYIYTELNKDAYKLERWLHAQFSKKRLEGEWFTSITVKEIRRKILQYNTTSLDVSL